MPYSPSQAHRRLTQRSDPRRAGAGFTLVEVMLASLLGVIVVGGVYQLFVNTSTHYTKQLDHGQAQARLRFAVEFIKSDLRSFGSLSILNTTLTQRDPLYCGVRTYTGLEMFNDDPGGGAYEPPALLVENELLPDRLRLLSAASDATPLALSNASGESMMIAPAASQVSNDARLLVGVGAAGRLRDAYTDSLARVTQLKTGAYDVVPVSGVVINPSSHIIRLNGAPCQELNCSAGGCVINPIKWLEYAVVEDQLDPSRTQLVRRQLDLADSTPIPNTELVLADYAVDFQVWGDYDTRGHEPNTGAPDINARLPLVPEEPAPNDDKGNWVALGVPEDEVMNRWPHRLRGLSFLVSVRTARVDPNIISPLNLVGAGPQERTHLRVTSARGAGYTYVSTLTGSVDNENLYRGD